MESKVKSGKVNSGLIVGLILILGGLLALAGQFVTVSLGGYFGTLLLLGLGLIFMVAGILTREEGWFIPGGILTGLGAGVALMASPWAARLPGEEGGWFLLVFAAGWALIPIMTAIFGEETHWWALIPGGIIGLVGAAVLFGGVFIEVLEWAGKLWPLILIIVGGLLLWKARRPHVKDVDEPVEKHA
jgi:hypothetical protein